MDTSYFPAVAALAGSAIGALASFVSTWSMQTSQARANRLMQARVRREKLYEEFILEAARLFADAFEHELDDPAKLVHLYAIVSMIRLFGLPKTLAAAEDVLHKIGATYFSPNKDVRLFADIALGGELDTLFAFSQACREELSSTYRE